MRDWVSAEGEDVAGWRLALTRWGWLATIFVVTLAYFTSRGMSTETLQTVNAILAPVVVLILVSVAVVIRRRG